MAIDAADVRRAFDEDEFFPVFQPLVELRTGQLAGFEVLARWQHRTLGAIAPDRFIPILEQTGLIDRLTQVMLEKSCALHAVTDHQLFLAVNLSPAQLLAFQSAERIAAVAARSCFPLDRLTIEITESALVDDLERAQSAARELKALNCKLALDDVGTGYSSLRHLHALPFDELKVDRSFVSTMAEKRESRKIVAAVIGLGQSLGMLTVAEGVETQEQANMLLWMGCDLGQGWLFGRPAPAGELERMIAEARARAAVAIPVPPDEGAVMGLEALPAHRLAQLQAIYDGAPVGLCFLDRKLRYVSINRRLARLNGRPASAHLGKTVAENIPDFFPRIEPFLRRALQGEPMSGVELRRPSADGHGETVLLSSYQPVRDEMGEVLGISVAVMDVTEAKRTEEALIESENHYRHLMQLSPHVPWVLNAEGEVTDASSRWEEFSGQPLREALGTGWLKALHPDDVGPTREAIRHTLETGEPIDVEYRVRRPGQDWVWMRSRGAPRFDDEGGIVSVYGVVEENGKKHVSDELERCELELQAAVSMVPVGIVIADATDGSIVIVNPRASKIFQGRIFAGQKLAEYLRLPCFRMDGTRHGPEDCALARAFQHGETIESRESLLERLDGSRAHLLISARSIDSVDGMRIGALMMVQELES